VHRLALAVTALAATALAVTALAGCDAPPVALQPAAPLPMYPTPRYFREERVALPVATACLDGGAFAESLAASWPALRARAGLAPATGATCDLTISFDREPPPDLEPAARAVWDAASPVTDRYVVLARLAGGRAVARVFAESDRAAHYAVAAALDRYDRALYHPGVIVDAGGFAERGVVEGHYGPPLATDERLCLLDAMARLRHNVYMYAPKDDPYHRGRWADLYPLDTARMLADTAAAARARHIDFIWSISPGASDAADAGSGALSFASDADFARLTTKLTAVAALGIDRFALLFDDTRTDLADPADRAAFPSLAAAHADLANRLDAWIVARYGTRLWFVSPYYTSYWDGWLPYNRDLGARLRPGIEVMWTGSHVYSPRLAAGDLREVDAALGRKVIIWDNEPEAAVALDGRAADLPDAVGAYLTNTVMLQRGVVFADLFRVFGTVGDFAWNPGAYDPDASLSAWTTRAGVCP
jgi:hypothetical protein